MCSRASAVGRVVFAASGLSLLPGCPPATAPPPPINVAPGLQAEYIVSGAEHPTALAFATDGRVFYTEKNTGRIRVIVDSALAELPFAEVPVNFAGDRGLLGIAVHPNFNLNSRVYVFYSRSDTGTATNDEQAIVDNRIVYFEANGDVAGGGEVFVASLPAGDQSGRVGGRITFSSDARLYVALGDLNNQDNAQDPGVLPGKILRYNDDGTIPSSNPDPNSPVYARGLRYPQGLTIDPDTGALLALDRNPLRFHEIDHIAAGCNYGWPQVIGVADTAQELGFAAGDASYRNPIFTSSDDRNPLVGISFNPSTKYGISTRLRLFYGVQGTGRVHDLELGGGGTTVVSHETFAVGLPTQITDIAFTAAGTLYIACENAILRVVNFP